MSYKVFRKIAQFVNRIAKHFNPIARTGGIVFDFKNGKAVAVFNFSPAWSIKYWVTRVPAN